MNETVKKQKRFQFSGVRYVFSLLGFLGFCLLYAIRVNLNVAIVTMVNRTMQDDDNQTVSDECLTDLETNLGNETTPVKEGEFLWSPSMQAVALGAFYYGYVITQIPGGRLAEAYGGKWVFGLGTFIPSLLTLLTPLAARYNFGCLVALRAMEGLAQGVTMPAMHAMLGRWIPDSERGFLATFVHVGISTGTVVFMPLTAFLCDEGPFGGWPSAFYFVGLLGYLWFLLWCLFVTDSPLDHPFITRNEVKHIITNQQIDYNAHVSSIPWGKVLTSVPFIALVVTQVTQDWCFYTIVNDLPTFFATILHFKVQENGFLNSVPQLMQTIVGVLVGFVSDLLIRRKLITIGFTRKFCNTVACVASAAGLVGVCLAGCDVSLHVIFFTTSIALHGFSCCGYVLSHIDLSPEYAGTLMGIANTVSNLTGFLAPLLVGVLTEHQNTLHQWHIVFYIAAAALLFGAFVYLLFVSAEKQPWSYPGIPTSLLNSPEEKNSTDIPIVCASMKDLIHSQ